MLQLTVSLKRLFITALILAVMMSLATFAQENGRIAELTKKSDLIFVGRVQGIHSEWNKNKTRIYSRITLKIDQLVKGEAQGSDVSFLQLGGEIGTIGEVYSDIPRFKDNEGVLLFLEKTDTGVNYRVTGGMEGKFPVEINTKLNQKTVGGTDLNNIIGQIKNVELKR